MPIDPGNPPWQNVTNAAASGTAERLALEYVAQTDGFMYIYVANETQEDVDVYFDDLTVTHTGINIVQSTDYYPYGLVLRETKNEPYRFGYQGQFAEKDSTTGWHHFALRQYGSRIGRWLVVDPAGEFFSPYLAMGNNPLMYADPKGDCVSCPKVGNQGDTYRDETGQNYMIGSTGAWTMIYGDVASVGSADYGNFWDNYGYVLYQNDGFFSQMIRGANNHAEQLAIYNARKGAFMEDASKVLAVSVGLPVATIFGGTLVGASPAISSAAASIALETNAITTYGFIIANGKVVGWAGALSASLGKIGYDVVRSRQVIMLRESHSWLRGPTLRLENAFLNLNILPSRGTPAIPLDPVGDPGVGNVLLPLWKLTPNN